MTNQKISINAIGIYERRDGHQKGGCSARIDGQEVRGIMFIAFDDGEVKIGLPVQPVTVETSIGTDARGKAIMRPLYSKMVWAVPQGLEINKEQLGEEIAKVLGLKQELQMAA